MIYKTINEICYYLPKSSIKAGEGKKIGIFPFFTSSDKQSLWLDKCIYNDECLIIGTGGKASCKYYKGKFAASTDNLVVGSREVNVKYIYYFLRSNKLKILEDGFRGAGLKHISKEYFGNILIPILTKQEQNELVKTLDEIASCKGNDERQLIILDELCESLFIDTFSNLPLVKISKYIKELRAGKSLAGSEVCENKVLKTGAATFGFFDVNQFKYLPTDYIPNQLHKVEKGDVIISRMNTPDLVGTCSYVWDVPRNYYYPDRLWKTILFSGYEPIFIWQCLKQPNARKQIKAVASGTSGTMFNISKPKLLETLVPDANPDIQKKFSSTIKSIEYCKVMIKNRLRLYEELFNERIHHYFK